MAEGKGYYESCQIAQDDKIYYFKQRDKYFGTDYDYECK